MEDLRYMGYEEIENIVNAKIMKSFSYMFLALLLTFGVSFSMFYSYSLFLYVYENYFIIIMLEIFVGMALSMMAYRANTVILTMLLFTYSVLTGLTLGVFMFIFSPESIISTLISVVILFLVLAIYGYKTDRILYSWGRILSIALISILIASIINIFLGVSILNLAISAGISILMMAYIVYDVNTIKNNILLLVSEGNYEIIERVQIVGAFALYLDFINLFINLLRIFGKRK